MTCWEEVKAKIFYIFIKIHIQLTPQKSYKLGTSLRQSYRNIIVVIFLNIWKEQ